TQAYDGETAWMINPQTGAAEELPPETSDDMRRQALGNDALLHPEKYGITYTYKGKEKINGKDYFVLEQVFSDGFKATLYVNPDTYLVYKTKARTTNQMGVEVEAETMFSEYKKIEGVMVPQKLTIYQDGEEFMTMTITEVKFNTGLEDSFFKMPD
ncbi:MAG: outer membrane lipoprotein-sorting protein, partial [Candidatus Aminicenantes bacterium]|nr:outer membrane lipoprotein-sorting protein [Candidatus Aminicenantes bacterium]